MILQVLAGIGLCRLFSSDHHRTEQIMWHPLTDIIWQSNEGFLYCTQCQSGCLAIHKHPLVLKEKANV